MVNKCIFVGYTGRAAELRFTPNGRAVASFSIAVTERWNDGDGNRKEHTEWVNVVAWGKLGEICGQYLDSKGRLIYAEGRLRTREYEDRDGQKRRATELIADIVRFLGVGGRQDGPRQPELPASSSAPASSINDDDIPF